MKPNFKVYTLVSFIISLFILGADSEPLSFVGALALSTAFVFFIQKNKMSEYFYIIPFIALMNGLFFAESLVIIKFKLYMVVAFLLIALLTVLSIFEKKDGLYTVMSAIYLGLAILCFSLNRYVNVLMVLIWSILHIFNRKEIKVYQVICYTSLLILYNMIVKDLKLDDITLCKLFGYIPYIYAMSRRVFGKQKELEYILTAIIYLVALNTYPNITNAMVFIAFLVAMVILGYQKKVGPLFLSSLIAVMINFFKLTLEFWKSVPWWVYLVTVGGLLLAFAIHNEINENKNKEKINQAFKKLKENVDL